MEPFLAFDEIDQHGPQEREATLDLTAEALARLEIVELGPVAIRARAEKGHLPGEYLVEGRVAFQADLQCSRCVDPYPFAMETDFTVRYRPRPAPSDLAEEVEIGEEELDVEFYDERVVSLRDLAEAQIQLTLPMKPICDERCLGLCASCGQNLNSGSCSCSNVVRDGRWDALLGIREELNRKKNS
jgi:uncharacterized protein